MPSGKHISRRALIVSVVGIAVLAFAIGGISCAAMAKDANTLDGTPLVQNASNIMIAGKVVSLWGISPLADDQQCLLGARAWPCGEQATIALKHYIENSYVECRIMDEHNKSGNNVAQCFRKRGKRINDVALFMVSHGWALDNPDSSGGQYAEAQDEATRKRRGIWTSRFQSAEDWRNGVQKYIDCNQPPPEGNEPSPPDDTAP